MKTLDEDFNLIEDKASLWAELNKDKEPKALFEQHEPSSEEDEMDSEKSPSPPQKSEREDDREEHDGSQSNLSEIQQNVLLEKVDEILMQIVESLPEQSKIKTLTNCMMPYLKQTVDESTKKHYLIISQTDFIQFLFGSGQNQLGLELNESHVICLLHLLVQEAEQDEEDEDPDNQFILFDEFIELVKTYMKKELIMVQSKSIGIHYDILSKESVEYLFQIRSTLMNSDNGDSDDEHESPSKQQRAVPNQLRNIFQDVISFKNIQMQKGSQHQRIEIMDFDQMMDVLQIKLKIGYPSNKAQEELKYLMSLDLKYLEMIMLVKFDKVMHDLDYISIDLLRQAQEKDLDEQRKMNLNHLRRMRDKVLGQHKKTNSDGLEQIHEVPSSNQGQRQVYTGVS